MRSCLREEIKTLLQRHALAAELIVRRKTSGVCRLSGLAIRGSLLQLVLV